ncbi:MAG TPA: DUF2306 domain-containing protein [Cyclobacteriaceae bacterium]|jgi:hypothetical protein|nr:DUF2306 domain-containing protein [Cyclobacteriaceae bacterium]
MGWWIKKFIFRILAFLAVLFGVLLYLHNSVFVFDGPDNGFLLTKTESVRYSIYLPAFYIHITTGSIVLMSGVFQLSKWIRTRYPRWHRSAGKFYLFVVLIFTAPSGFVMSLYANGGLSATIAFALLALLWWLFTWKGFQNAVHKQWDTHREFMLRSYALTFSAVTLRLYSFLFALAGFRGESIYVVIAWLSWVLSLIVMEIWIRQKAFKQVKESLLN